MTEVKPTSNSFDTMKMTDEEVIKFAKIFEKVMNCNPVKSNCLTNLLKTIYSMTHDESRVLDEDEKKHLESNIFVFKYTAS